MRQVRLLALLALVLPALPMTAQNPAPPAISEDTNGKVSGLGIILKVQSLEADRLIFADGYRIRLSTPRTITTLSGTLKTLADVQPNTWIRYEGVRDATGVLVAQTAKIYPAGTRKGFTAMGAKKTKQAPDYQPIKQDSLLDADGRFVNPRTKVRLSDAGGPCGWHRVPADEPLQDRVERVGMRIVPEYQKQLAHNSPSRISFRFYAVTDDQIRSVFACNTGLILIPKSVVERLQSDDELAAVLADGVGLNLVRQLDTIPSADSVAMGTEVVAAFAGGVPGLWAVEGLAGIVGHEKMLRLERECARIALQLMAEGGYDPWEAPEAWRRVVPKELPTDIQSLEYPREAKYQLSILKAQYKKTGGSRMALSSADPAL